MKIKFWELTGVIRDMSSAIDYLKDTQYTNLRNELADKIHYLLQCIPNEIEVEPRD